MKRYERNEDVRVLFLGTPDMARTVLAGIVEAGYDVIGVVTQPDKEAGRGHKLVASPVKQYAMERGIPVYQPAKIREDYSFAEYLKIDVIACMAYGQIVPEGFLSLAKVGAVNVHGSLLPEYRGAAPIQRAIMDGRKVTGVSLMEMVAAMDAGAVYDTRECPIEESDDYTSLGRKLAALGAEMIAKDLLAYANRELPGKPQDEEKVTIAKKIKKVEERVSLELTAEAARDAFRGLSEEPGGYLVLGGLKLKVYRCHLSDGPEKGEKGDYFIGKKTMVVRFSDGYLALDEVQLEGKKRMDIASFLNGMRSHLAPEGKVD